MISRIKSILGLNKSSILEGEEGIRQVGHRRYVGGRWEEIGKLQFEFLIKNGLRSNDVFMDIACGSLRAGVHLIPYLDSGNYLGIEKEKSLVDIGIKEELGEGILESKIPEFVISDGFEFGKFSKKPNYAIAQSLFSHLPPSLINLCFQKLSTHIAQKGVFYATYFLSSGRIKNPDQPHDHGVYWYTKDEVQAFGENNGWNTEIIGDWKHPRGQKMVKYTLK